MNYFSTLPSDKILILKRLTRSSQPVPSRSSIVFKASSVRKKYAMILLTDGKQDAHQVWNDKSTRLDRARDSEFEVHARCAAHDLTYYTIRSPLYKIPKWKKKNSRHKIICKPVPPVTAVEIENDIFRR